MVSPKMEIGAFMKTTEWRTAGCDSIPDNLRNQAAGQNGGEKGKSQHRTTQFTAVRIRIRIRKRNSAVCQRSKSVYSVIVKTSISFTVK
jgi:starvation-inducible outer membrane lipoprotein